MSWLRIDNFFKTVSVLKIIESLRVNPQSKEFLRAIFQPVVLSRDIVALGVHLRSAGIETLHAYPEALFFYSAEISWHQVFSLDHRRFEKFSASIPGVPRGSSSG